MTYKSILDASRNIVLMLVAASLLGGCGGGGSAAGSLYHIPPQSGGNPGSFPTPGPNAVLAIQTLKGAPGFINAAGHTLYVFDADLAWPGHSVCNGDCAANWPPLAPPAGKALIAPFSATTRDDGSKQLAYAGRPLYAFIVDTAPGQTSGDGINAFGGIWHIARPH
jgi:predicted lipoprotein with Yx(FWY)xxD motif